MAGVLAKRIVTCSVAVLALALTACGSSDSPSGGGGPTVNSGAFTGSIQLPDGTIGILNILGSSEVTARWVTSAEKATAAIGWKSTTIDGKGDPAIWGQALSTFVQRKVDGIIIIGGVQQGPIASQLQAAKSANIPVVVSGVRSPDPGGFFSAVYAPDDGEFGVLLANYLVKTLPSGATWVAQTLTVDEGANKPNVTALPILESAGHKRVGVVDLNISSDLPGQVTRGAVNLLTAHPEAKLLFGCCDFSTPLTVPALKQAGHGDVIHSVRYDNLTTLKMISDGEPVVTAAANADQGPLTAVAQIIRSKADGSKIDPAAADKLWEFTVVDKSNVPAGGKYFYDPDAQVAKWLAQLQTQYKK